MLLVPPALAWARLILGWSWWSPEPCRGWAGRASTAEQPLGGTEMGLEWAWQLSRLQTSAVPTPVPQLWVGTHRFGSVPLQGTAEPPGAGGDPPCHPPTVTPLCLGVLGGDRGGTASQKCLCHLSHAKGTPTAPGGGGNIIEQWGGKKQKFLEIFTVYKSLFNWFLTLVLLRGC